MRLRVFALAGIAALLLTAPAEADFASNISAALPDTLGQMAGNMAAGRVDFEKLCLAGEPLPEVYRASAVKEAQSLMAAYFKAAASKKSRLGSQLRDKDEGAHWIGPQGEADLDKLSDPYLSDPTHSTPELKEIVVAGNLLTVRAVWSFTIAKPGDPAARQKIEYGIDILHSYWRAYKIWHIHVYLEPDTAPVPAAYCVFDPATAY
jgi:hypothetical protein